MAGTRGATPLETPGALDGASGDVPFQRMRHLLAVNLSDERRTELATLLADEAKFTATYPAVADYLATASALRGTGDAAADNAFDLRLLHFMTAEESENPYWEIVAPSVDVGPPERGRRREVNGGSPDGSARLAYAQTVLQAAYAYAIPSPATVRWVAAMCDGRPLVEMGAGRGYWAHQLAHAGVSVRAYDLHTPGDGNPWFAHAGAPRSIWHGVKPVAIWAELMRSEDVLFLCWPPGWDNPMSSEALAAYERAGGDRLVYVGEHRGGKSGDGAFFDALAERWELVGTDAAFVSWWNLSDVAESWARK